MSQSWIWVGLLVGGVACLPYLVRLVQARRASWGYSEGKTTLLSVLAVGPQQKVITIKVSSNDKEATLVLGVTPNSVNCLHKWESADGARPALEGVSGEVSSRGLQ